MKRTLEEVKENIQKAHGNNITLLNEILPKYKEKLTLRCNTCGKTFEATYDNLVNKKSKCPHCLGRIKTTEDFVKEIIDIFGDKLIYDKVKYINAKTNVIITCPKHGDFVKTPNKLLIGQGCKKCKRSMLENIVSNKLLNANVDFVEQKKFNWLGLQSLDFYLPKYNIAIECQGEQHFHQVYFNGKTDDIEERNLYESIRKRDELKFKLCEENGVSILYLINNKISIEEIKNNKIYSNGYYYDINEMINNIINC